LHADDFLGCPNDDAVGNRVTRPPGGAPAHEWFAAGLRPGAHARLLVTLVLYAAGAGVLALSPPVGLAVPVAVGLGFLLATALPVMHEAAHGHLGASPGVDRAVGTAAGAAILAAFPCYREVHLAPHDHLGGDGDAEIPCPVTSVATYLSLLSPRYFLIPFWGETLRALRGQRGQRVDAKVPCPLGEPNLHRWLALRWAYRAMADQRPTHARALRGLCRTPARANPPTRRRGHPRQSQGTRQRPGARLPRRPRRLVPVFADVFPGREPDRTGPRRTPVRQQAFAEMKAHLRAHEARSHDALWRAIGNIRDLFKPTECWNSFKHADHAYE